MRTPLSRTTSFAILAAAVVVGLVVRLLGLGERGLWLDEAYSALLATGSWSDLFARLETDSGPPLYYVVLKGWVGIAGASEGALRLPSAVGGALAVVAAWALSRRLRVGVGAWLAVAAIAVLPILVYHSQDARYYAWLPALGLLVAWALVRAFEIGDRSSFVVYGGASIVAAYVHNYGLFLPVAATAAAFVWRRGVRWRPFLVASLAAWVAYLPWTPWLLKQIRHGGTGWAVQFATPDALVRSLEAMAPGGRPPGYIALPAESPARVAAWVLIGLTSVLVVVALRRRAAETADGELRLATETETPRPSFARRVTAMFVFALVPWVVGWAVSLAGMPIYIPARIDQFGVGVLVVAVSAAVSRWPTPVWAAHAAFAGALSIVSLVGRASLDRHSGDRDLADFVEGVADEHPVVVAADLLGTPLAYYIEQRDIDVDLVRFPLDMNDHPGNIVYRRIFDNGQEVLARFDAALREALTRADDPTFLAVTPANHLGAGLHRYFDTVAERDRSAAASFRMGITGTPIEVARYRWHGGAR